MGSLHFSLHTFRVLGLKLEISFAEMRYVAAYLLAALGGNSAPSSDSIVKILSSVGIEAESDKLEKVIYELSGKDLKTLVAEGHAKLASMPAGGSAAPAAAGQASAAAP